MAEKESAGTGVRYFSQRLRVTIGSRSVRGFARQCGFSEGVLRSYLKGDTYPTLDRLNALAKAGGVDEAWLATGLSAIPQTSYVAESEAPAYTHPQLPGGTTSGVVAQPPQLTVMSGGNTVVHTLTLRPEWLAERGLNVQRLQLVNVVGDSMQPTIMAGSLLLVANLEHAQLVGDGIYVIHNSGKTLVRRLQHDFDGSIHVISDNPAYREHLVPKSRIEELDLVGRVVWVGHEF